jgi:hypothetical protein
MMRTERFATAIAAAPDGATSRMILLLLGLMSDLKPSVRQTLNPLSAMLHCHTLQEDHHRLLHDTLGAA